MIVNIETATTNCSVSVAEAGKCIVRKEYNDVNYSHAENLHVFIRQALREASVGFNELDAISVSKGPGSYTGLRIGIAAAKGLCFALQVPLISVPTLHALALQHQTEKGYIVPLLDARRMEVYAAVYDKHHHPVRETQAEIISKDSFAQYLEEDRVYFLGTGAEKCTTVIVHPNAYFGVGHFPSSREMTMLSEAKFKAGDFENTAYFEPFYLKDFVVG